MNGLGKSQQAVLDLLRKERRGLTAQRVGDDLYWKVSSYGDRIEHGPDLRRAWAGRILRSLARHGLAFKTLLGDWWPSTGRWMNPTSEIGGRSPAICCPGCNRSAAETKLHIAHGTFMCEECAKVMDDNG